MMYTGASVAETASDIQEVVARAIEETSYERFRKPDDMVAWIASDVQQTVNDYVDERVDTSTRGRLHDSPCVRLPLNNHRHKTSLPSHRQTIGPDYVSRADAKVVDVSYAVENMRNLIDVQDKTLVGLVCKLDELRSEIKRMEVNSRLDGQPSGDIGQRVRELEPTNSPRVHPMPEQVRDFHQATEAVSASLTDPVKHLPPTKERRLSKREQCAEREDVWHYPQDGNNGYERVSKGGAPTLAPSKPTEGRRVSFVEFCPRAEQPADADKERNRHRRGVQRRQP